MIRMTPPPMVTPPTIGTIRMTPPRAVVVIPPIAWGSDVERERRNRIRLSIAAYAYECEDNPVMTDAEFDQLARSIDPRMDTDNPVMDAFFRSSFSPDTGMWIREHPQLDRIIASYRKHYGNET